MSNHEEKKAPKANPAAARQNEQANKAQQKPGQPQQANRAQADARNMDSSAQLRWSEERGERGERNERGERSERNEHSENSDRSRER